jgi:hypothetical protein
MAAALEMPRRRLFASRGYCRGDGELGISKKAAVIISTGGGEGGWTMAVLSVRFYSVRLKAEVEELLERLDRLAPIIQFALLFTQHGRHPTP